jgi:hypothetical protein
MTRYRHTGMHENILLVVTERPGIGYGSLRRAVIGPPLEEDTPDSVQPFVLAMKDLMDAERIEYATGGYRLRPPSDRFSARLRRFLLSFPGIPRYGARRSQRSGE